MADTLAERVRNTQNSFPSQPAGATVPCPLSNPPTDAAGGAGAAGAPVEVKTNFALTQQMLQTMGGRPSSEKTKEKTAWIEILLVDNEGQPMPGVRYRITPPGGSPVEGRLDEHGQAGLYMIEPGNCKITFPDLDKDAWE